MHYKIFETKLTGADETARTLRHVITTESPDRDGDVIDADGWDLSEFARNPVVLFGHRHDRPPVGRCVEIKRTARGLEAVTQFPPAGVDPFADKVFELNRLGFLRSWSVGFLPKRWSPRTDGEGKRAGTRYHEQALLEYSSVPVPANPEAVSLAVSKGLVGAEEQKEFFDVESRSGMPAAKEKRAGQATPLGGERDKPNKENTLMQTEILKNTKDVAEDVAALRSDVDGVKETLSEHDGRIAALESGTKESRGASKAAALFAPSASAAGRKGKFAHADGARFVDFLKAMRDGDARRAKALGGQTDSAGGYLVPTEHLGIVARVVEEFGLARRLATLVPMRSDTLNVPTLADAVAASWVDEGVLAPDADPVFAQTQLTAKEARFKTVVSNALLEDSDPRVADLVAALFGEAIAKAEDSQAFNGNGAPFTGLRFAAGVNEVDAAGSAATLDHLIDLEMSVSAGARAGAAYFMASPMLGRLKKLKDAEGQPLWMPAAGEMPQSINGYPLHVTEEIPVNLGAGSDETLVFFGNLRHLYLGERSPFAVKASEHVRFENDQTVFVGRERVALKVVAPEAFARLVNVKTA